MMKINEENLTHEEYLKIATLVINQSDADQHFSRYVEFIQKILDSNPVRNDRASAHQIAKLNLGFYAAHHSKKKRERVERLFLSIRENTRSH